MRYFLDTEFIEDGKTIDLISIGIVCEDGREYYALNWDCDWTKASDWVRENVIEQLPPKPKANVFHAALPDFREQGWRNHAEIAKEVTNFVNWFPDKPHFGPSFKPEFWGYYADYDWVVFCQLFGTMMDLPKGFPMYCRDIKQWCDQLNNPQLPEQGKGEHNALADARWNKAAWEFLRKLEEDVVVERQ
jgi:hypothetical protein